jgi:methyl-accepting chemotaxis protein
MKQLLRISTKLPVIIVGAGLLVGIGIGTASYLTASSSMATISQQHLAASAETARDTFIDYMHTIERDLHSVATNPVTTQAINGFKRAWMIMDTPTETLQAAYITDNPHPVGEKHLLDQAASGQMYDSIHGSYHPWFRELQESNGYYDVFLFDTDGNLIYSVFKEADFATNFGAPGADVWADSDLGEVFRAALNAPDSAPIAFEDFAPYGPSADAPASFVAHAVRDQADQMVGVIAYQMPVDAINAVFAEVGGLGESGEVALIGPDGLLRNDSTWTEVNDILATSFDSDLLTATFANGSASARAPFYRGEEMQAYANSFTFEGVDYAVVAMKSMAEKMAPIHAIRDRMLMIGALLIVIVGVIGVFLSRSVTRPINTLVREMGELAGGNTSIALEGAERSDELGDMSKAVAVFRDAMIERERLEGETAQAAAERRARQQEIDKLIADFQIDVEAVVEAVSANAQAMTAAAGTLTEVASNTNEQASSAAAASEEASTNVQTVAAAAEELSASITEIGRQVAKTTEVVGSAATHSQATNDQVEKLAETANAIGNVVSLIQDIAEQTNLLALNATIEAARAGEAGKGFAVVASEVKGLAEQTAKATGDIAAQINEIQSSTQEAVSAINQITKTMGDVDEYMSSIAASVEEQGAATDEISHNVAQAAQGTQSVVGNITAVTGATTQTAQSADEVNAAAGSVTENTKKLNETVSTFLRAVAAA